MERKSYITLTVDVPSEAVDFLDLVRKNLPRTAKRYQEREQKDDPPPKKLKPTAADTEKVKRPGPKPKPRTPWKAATDHQKKELVQKYKAHVAEITASIAAAKTAQDNTEVKRQRQMLIDKTKQVCRELGVEWPGKRTFDADLHAHGADWV